MHVPWCTCLLGAVNAFPNCLLKKIKLTKKIRGHKSLIMWSIVCMEKKDGGLRIRNVSMVNKILIGKWCWRFAYQNEYFWK